MLNKGGALSPYMGVLTTCPHKFSSQKNFFSHPGVVQLHSLPPPPATPMLKCFDLLHITQRFCDIVSFTICNVNIMCTVTFIDLQRLVTAGLKCEFN